MKVAPLPKISVITPSYNQGVFLEDTILSVLGQNYPNLEYIVIDGGSCDGSLEIIKKYEKHLAYWESVKDNGQSHAINKGMEKATGDILCWLNSDDLFLPSTFSYVSKLFLNSGKPALIYGNCILFRETENGMWALGTDVVGAAKTSALEAGDYIIQPSTFWTKTAWQQLGTLREEMHYAFDWEWFLRAKKSGIDLQPVNKILSMYRHHETHKTANGGEKRRDEIAAVYHQYSGHYASLYNMIRQESFDTHTLSQKMVRRVLRLFKKSITQGYLLKHSKRSKYKTYSYQDMDHAISML
jgi:glycosyltransferase involved in cell wall biosynthesis